MLELFSRMSGMQMSRRLHSSTKQQKRLKSFGKKKYSYSACEGENNTILCGKYSGECTKAPWLSNTGEVIYDEVDFEHEPWPGAS